MELWLHYHHKLILWSLVCDLYSFGSVWMYNVKIMSYMYESESISDILSGEPNHWVLRCTTSLW